MLCYVTKFRVFVTLGKVRHRPKSLKLESKTEKIYEFYIYSLLIVSSAVYIFISVMNNNKSIKERRSPQS